MNFMTFLTKKCPTICVRDELVANMNDKDSENCCVQSQMMRFYFLRYQEQL